MTVKLHASDTKTESDTRPLTKSDNESPDMERTPCAYNDKVKDMIIASIIAVVCLLIGIPFIVSGSIGMSKTPHSEKHKCTFYVYSSSVHKKVCHIKTTPAQYDSQIPCDTSLPGCSSRNCPQATIGDTVGVREYTCYYIPSTGKLQLDKATVPWAITLVAIGSPFTAIGLVFVVCLIYIRFFRDDEYYLSC